MWSNVLTKLNVLRCLVCKNKNNYKGVCIYFEILLLIQHLQIWSSKDIYKQFYSELIDKLIWRRKRRYLIRKNLQPDNFCIALLTTDTVLWRGTFDNWKRSSAIIMHRVLLGSRGLKWRRACPTRWKTDGSDANHPAWFYQVQFNYGHNQHFSTFQ